MRLHDLRRTAATKLSGGGMNVDFRINICPKSQPRRNRGKKGGRAPVTSSN